MAGQLSKQLGGGSRARGDGEGGKRDRQLDADYPLQGTELGFRGCCAVGHQLLEKASQIHMSRLSVRRS